MSGTGYVPLPAPVTADPGFWQKGIEGLNALRDQQAKQASADAYRQSINPDGTINTPKYNALIAGGPGAWNAGQLMEQQGRAAGAQAQAGSAQADQAQKVYNFVAAPSASLMNDPSDANLANIRQQLVTAGAPPGVIAELDRMKTLSEADRRTVAYQHNMAGADTQHRLAAGGFPALSLTNTGGQLQPLGVVQPSPYSRGGVVGGTGSVPTTASPDTVVSMPDIMVPATADDVKNGLAKTPGEQIHISGADRIKRYGYTRLLPAGAVEVPGTGGNGGGGGVVDNTGKPVSGANPPHLNVPNQPASPPAAPGGYQGTGTGGPTDTMPIYQPPAGTPPAASQPPSVAPPPVVSTSPTLRGRGSAATPPPSVNAPVDSMTPGPRAALQGGVPIASANPLLAPTVGAAGPPSPLVPGDVSAIMQGMNRARATPLPGTQVAGASFSTGPGYDEQVTAKTSQDRLAADQTAAANYAANVFPQTQALAALGRGVTTAPGADVANMMKGWAGGVYRSLGGTGAFDSTKDFDEVHKWYNQIALGNPLAAGSDARLATTLAGNANTSIHELAGADMMKAGIALMRMNATASDQWVNNPAIRAQYGYYTNYLRDFNKTVDPRAFAWDMYNDAQRADLIADLEKHRSDPAYGQRLKDSLSMVRGSGYIGEIRAMPNAK